jgi:hypothetical protein
MAHFFSDAVEVRVLPSHECARIGAHPDVVMRGLYSRRCAS